MGPHAGRADYKCKASVMRTYLMSLRNSMGGPVWLELRWDQMISGTWDCLPQQCNACTWTHISWSKQQNMKKLYGAKNKCMHAQLGQIMNKKIQKDPKNQMATSEDLGEKTLSGAKAGYWECPLHSPPQRGEQTTWHPSANPLDIPLSSSGVRNQKPASSFSPRGGQGSVPCFCSLLWPQKPQWKLAWIDCLAFSQFLLTGEGQEPWSVSEWARERSMGWDGRESAVARSYQALWAIVRTLVLTLCEMDSQWRIWPLTNGGFDLCCSAAMITPSVTGSDPHV